MSGILVPCGSNHHACPQLIFNENTGLWVTSWAWARSFLVDDGVDWSVPCPDFEHALTIHEWLASLAATLDAALGEEKPWTKS